MTKGTTMKIVGYFACNPKTLKPEWGEDCVCQDDVYDPEETGTIGRPFVFADQAEAYKDACVREAQQWHPIETVPEEGPYLVYGGQLAGEAPDLLENLDVIKVNGRVFGDTNFKKSDVVFDVSDAGYSWILILNPTHWMPLPEPPCTL